jgi:hypothetical protein
MFLQHQKKTFGKHIVDIKLSTKKQKSFSGQEFKMFCLGIKSV